MTTQPDPNRHEASRPAFESSCPKHYTREDLRDELGEYFSPLRESMWQSWQAALDWRDSQVCEWKWNAKWDWWESGCVDQRASEEIPRYPFCPGCGRRVKIQAKKRRSERCKAFAPLTGLSIYDR